MANSDDLSDYLFARSDEWIRPGSDTIVIGFSEHAQASMGEVHGVELPEPDDHHYEPDEDIGVVEADAMTRDFRAPVPGTIVAINTNLFSHPELINEEPYGRGWLVEMKPDSMDDLEDLMHVDEYEEMLPELDEED